MEKEKVVYVVKKTESLWSSGYTVGVFTDLEELKTWLKSNEYIRDKSYEELYYNSEKDTYLSVNITPFNNYH